MATTTIDERELEMDALSLMDFLNETVGEDEGLTVVYVEDDTGRKFERVKLVRDTLTDGSEVYTITLS